MAAPGIIFSAAPFTVIIPGRPSTATALGMARSALLTTRTLEQEIAAIHAGIDAAAGELKEDTSHLMTSGRRWFRVIYEVVISDGRIEVHAVELKKTTKHKT